MAMDVVAHHYVRRQRTDPDASYGFQGILHIGGSLAFVYVQVLLDQFQYRLSSTHMAGRAPAHPDNFSAPWLSVKLGVEANHPLHLTGEEPQAPGYERYGLRRDIAELALNPLQQRYHGPLLLAAFGDNSIYTGQFSLCDCFIFVHRATAILPFMLGAPEAYPVLLPRHSSLLLPCMLSAKAILFLGLG
jgi:hypothetical protein